MAWLQKLLDKDLNRMTAQEHIELDSLYSEFDMPLRWGLLRIRELDVLNIAALTVAFFTTLSGVLPTDLGVLPGGSLRSCPVQFHNCISSSNSPADSDHYAPPLRWAKSKSAEQVALQICVPYPVCNLHLLYLRFQAYDEVKSAYLGYPKRGLKWTSGWIDRGGWKPQQFGGPYFYAQVA
jgi:hypothetical protein